MKAAILLAVADADSPPVVLQSISPALRERLILIGTVFLVVVAVVAGILVGRRLRRHRSRRREHSHLHNSQHQTTDGMADQKHATHRQRRHRHHHHEHRKQNPTLAEVGGLPPLRSGASLDAPQRDSQPQ